MGAERGRLFFEIVRNCWRTGKGSDSLSGFKFNSLWHQRGLTATEKEAGTSEFSRDTTRDTRLAS